jgi:hypothetical protein
MLAMFYYRIAGHQNINLPRTIEKRQRAPAAFREMRQRPE